MVCTRAIDGTYSGVGPVSFLKHRYRTTEHLFQLTHYNGMLRPFGTLQNHVLHDLSWRKYENRQCIMMSRLILK